jgi:hypothetical protein
VFSLILNLSPKGAFIAILDFLWSYFQQPLVGLVEGAYFFRTPSVLWVIATALPAILIKTLFDITDAPMHILVAL